MIYRGNKSDNELYEVIIKECDTNDSCYYICSTDKELYYDPIKPLEILERENLSENEVATATEAMANWLAIILTEKQFRDKEWIFYKERREQKQMTIFDYMGV